MAINLRDRLTFLFNGGKGIGTDQLDGAVVQSISRSGEVTQQTASNTQETFNLPTDSSNLPDLPDSVAEDRDYKARVPSSGDPLWVRDTHDYNDLTNKPFIPEKADDDKIDAEIDDSDYVSVLGVFRAIARKIVNASTTVRGLVLLNRNVDVDATETDTSRVTTVAGAKRLVDRIRPSNRQLPEPTADPTDGRKIAALNAGASAYELVSQPVVPGKATTTTDGLMAKEDKSKLDGVAAGAEVNVQSDWDESDNSADAYIANKPTIPVVPGKATTSADGLMASEDKSKLDGVAAGAEVNVQSDWDETDTNSDAHILNKPAIPVVPGAATTSADGLMASEDKAKLDGIEANAKDDQTAAELRDSLQTLTGDDRLSANAIKDLPDDAAGEENVQSDWDETDANSDAYILNKPTIPVVPGVATTDADGLMASEDKAKLDGVAAGAEVNVQADWDETDTNSDAHILNKPTIPVVPGLATTAADGLMAGADKAKLDGIEANAKDDQTASELRDNLQTLTGDDRLNASAIRNLPAGEENVQADWSVSDAMSDAFIKNKPAIPVVPGVATTDANGLMASADKSKLDGIAAGAEVNVQPDWNEADTNSDAYIQNKPTITAVPGKATTSADGLMASEDKSKLDGIAAGAEVNVQADWDETDTNSDAHILNKPAIPVVPGKATTTADGLMAKEDKAKLDGVEANAKDDQTANEIKSLYESNANTNVFTDTEQSKLSNIEPDATADQTASEIKFAYESNNNTNAFTDSEKSKLAGLDANAAPDQTASEIKSLYESNPNTNAFTDADNVKLGGIEDNATGDQTASEIKSLYESNSNTNAFTDGEKAKLTGIENNATADQTAAELVTSLESLSGDSRLDSSAIKNLSGDSYDHTANERRLAILEQKTSELDVRDHDSWVDTTQVANAAMFAQLSDIETTPEIIVGFSWALSQTITTAGNYSIFLRLAVGTDVNYRQVAHENAAGVAQPDLHGNWVTLLTQGGFNYYYWQQPLVGGTWQGFISLALNDALRVQSTQTATHTEYYGEVPGKITESERRAVDYARVRVSDLDVVNVPVWNAQTSIVYALVPSGGAQDQRIPLGQAPTGSIVWRTDYTLTAPEAGSYSIIIRVPVGLRGFLKDYRVTLDSYSDILDTFFDYNTGTTYIYYAQRQLQLEAGQRIAIQHHGSATHTRYDGQLADAALATAFSGANADRADKFSRFNADGTLMELDDDLTLEQVAKLVRYPDNPQGVKSAVLSHWDLGRFELQPYSAQVYNENEVNLREVMFNHADPTQADGLRMYIPKIDGDIVRDQIQVGRTIRFYDIALTDAHILPVPKWEGEISAVSHFDTFIGLRTSISFAADSLARNAFTSNSLTVQIEGQFVEQIRQLVGEYTEDDLTPALSSLNYSGPYDFRSPEELRQAHLVVEPIARHLQGYSISAVNFTLNSVQYAATSQSDGTWELLPSSLSDQAWTAFSAGLSPNSTLSIPVNVTFSKAGVSNVVLGGEVLLRYSSSALADTPIAAGLLDAFTLVSGETNASLSDLREAVAQSRAVESVSADALGTQVNISFQWPNASAKRLTLFVSEEVLPRTGTYSLDRRVSSSDFALGSGTWTGGASNGITVWILDSVTRMARAYVASTMARDADRDINLGAGSWSGAVANGPTIWFIDNASNYARAYVSATRVRDADKDINLGSGNWVGATTDGITLWFVNSTANYARAYVSSTSARDSARDINLGTGDWTGAVSDGINLWFIANVSSSGANIRAYTASTRAHDPTEDFTLGTDDIFWQGGFLIGTTLFFVDNTNNYARAFNIRSYAQFADRGAVRYLGRLWRVYQADVPSSAHVSGIYSARLDVIRNTLQASPSGSASTIRNLPHNIISYGRFLDSALVNGNPPSAPQVIFNDDVGPIWTVGDSWGSLSAGIPTGSNPLWRAEQTARWDGFSWVISLPVYTRVASDSVLFATSDAGANASTTPPANWTYFAFRLPDGSLSPWIEREQSPQALRLLWHITDTFQHNPSGVRRVMPNPFNLNDYRYIEFRVRNYFAGTYNLRWESSARLATGTIETIGPNTDGLSQGRAYRIFQFGSLVARVGEKYTPNGLGTDNFVIEFEASSSTSRTITAIKFLSGGTGGGSVSIIGVP